MQKKYACVRYLHSRLTVYHACKIDLRHSKALHSCATCRLLHLGLPCSAIHYGVCQAVNLPLPPQTPTSKHKGPKPVLAQKSKPISVPSAKPVPVPVPKSGSVQKPKQESVIPVEPVLGEVPKVVSVVQRPRTTPSPMPIAVVPVVKKSSPPTVDVINNNTWPIPAPKPAPQPQPNHKPVHANFGQYPNLGPVHTEQTTGHHTGPGPSARVGGGGGGVVGGGQAAKMVIHSVQPSTPVMVRTSLEGSVTLPGGGILVRTGSENGSGTVRPGLEVTRTGLPVGTSCASSEDTQPPQTPPNTFDLNANAIDGTGPPIDSIPIRGRTQDGTEQRSSGCGPREVVVTRTPVRVASSRPASVPACGSKAFPRFPAGDEEEEEEDFPAFPVGPADRAQPAAPSSGQKLSPSSPGVQISAPQTPVNDLTPLHHATSTTTTASTTATTTITTTTTSNTITTPALSTSTSTIDTTLPSPTSSPPHSSALNSTIPPLVSPTPTPTTTIPSGNTSSQGQIVEPESHQGPRITPPDTTTTTTPVVDSVPSSSSTTSSSSSSSRSLRTTMTTTEMMGVGMGVGVEIPPFHFPRGQIGGRVEEEVEEMVQKAEVLFGQLEGQKASREQMGPIAKACGFPLYWRWLLYRGASGDQQGYVTPQAFSAMLHKLYSTHHDEASRFVSLVAKSGCMSLEFEDFVPLIQDIVDGHPGLSFLQEAPEFHSRYIHTVISRIFFCINRSWTGRITVRELRRSSFLRVLSILENEEDINRVTDFFSYEHFYVIYCKFWELDKDHDLFIDKEDLSRHNDHALNSRLIDRIFSGAVTRGPDFQEGRMPYKEFVWFLIAEEDKKHPTSIEYWFRCMDLDGDGVISMFEMEHFYEEQMAKMEALGIEKLPFTDCLCQMFDLVRPRVEERITLSDLKNCRMADIFFDTFFNLDKFLEHEQRDPFAATREVDGTGREMTDWERYAAEEYDILVAEEGLNEPEEIPFDEDLEMEDEDTLEEQLQGITDPSPQRNATPRLHPGVTHPDDIYDFAANDLGF
ncbi:hypothetical protein ACOMHN_018293 [Nucella lapillus]